MQIIITDYNNGKKYTMTCGTDCWVHDGTATPTPYNPTFTETTITSRWADRLSRMELDDARPSNFFSLQTY